MNLKTSRIKRVLKILQVLEVLYLITFFWILYILQLPIENAQVLIEYWIIPSYFLLPLLLFKNVVVAINGNGKVSSRQKMWLIVRCAFYVALAVLTYPLIS